MTVITKTRVSVSHLIRSLQELVDETDADEDGIVLDVNFVHENSQIQRDTGFTPGSILFDIKNPNGSMGTLYIKPERASDILQ